MKLELTHDNSDAIKLRAVVNQSSLTYALNQTLREWRESLKSGAKMPMPKARPQPRLRKK